MANKKVYILNHPHLPTSFNHRFFVLKFAGGFRHHGYDVELVNKLEDLKDPGFVITSDIPFFFYRKDGNRNLLRNFFLLLESFDAKIGLFRRYYQSLKRSMFKQMARQIKDKGIVLLAWTWDMSWDRPGHCEYIDMIKETDIPTIFTGVDFVVPPTPEKQFYNLYSFYKENPNDSLPITFAADVDPDKVGDQCTNEEYAVSFVGSARYRPEWYNLFADRKDCRICPSPPYISEEERIDIYRKSKISLGFHAPRNASDAVITERVYEALAYGAICLTDNVFGSQGTDGCAQQVKDKEELLRLVDLYEHNKEKRLELRNKGFEFIRKQGTYAHQAKKFIDFEKKRFGLIDKHVPHAGS